MRQYHGIKVGDLVKFKHDMFDALGDVHLVTKAWTSGDGNDSLAGPSGHIVLHRGNDIQHRAKNFIVISKARKREV